MLVLAVVATGVLFIGAYTVFDREFGDETPASAETPKAATPTATSSSTATPTATATATPVPPTATPTPRSYIVQPGDSYLALAARFGVPVERLLEVNHRTLDTPLFTGVVLIIP